MIVWGGLAGSDLFNTGGRYNPAMDVWIATNTTGAPSNRFGHTVVWTGGEMIIWGGSGGGITTFNTGGRYNPATNAWLATDITGTPSKRSGHSAAWTGSEMIVWGGNDGPPGFNSGGRY
jgi:N-acetylneuraminic acid mutarotase